jgi:2'-5' RNA ligase
MRMIAIASLLNMQANQQVQHVWDLLDANCGLSEMQLTPLPHFTWHSAENYQLDIAEPILRKITVHFTPFVVSTAGIGIFTGPTPVLYLALVKTQVMMNIHKILWNELAPLGNMVNEYYSPARWMPHITLAIRDITPQNLACAMEGLLYYPFEMDILVDNLAVIYQVGDYDGVKVKFNFPVV